MVADCGGEEEEEEDRWISRNCDTCASFKKKRNLHRVSCSLRLPHDPVRLVALFN